MCCDRRSSRMWWARFGNRRVKSCCCWFCSTCCSITSHCSRTSSSMITFRIIGASRCGVALLRYPISRSKRMVVSVQACKNRRVCSTTWKSKESTIRMMWRSEAQSSNSQESTSCDSFTITSQISSCSSFSLISWKVKRRMGELIDWWIILNRLL